MPRPDRITFEELQTRVQRWTTCVERIAEGHKQAVYYYEYLNDMDTRKNTGLAIELHKASADPIAIKDMETRLAEADVAFLECTEETAACIWRDENSQKHGWNREAQWFYYRRPKIRLSCDDDLWPDARE